MNRFCLSCRRYYFCSIYTLFQGKSRKHDGSEDGCEFSPKNGIQRVIEVFSEKSISEPSEATLSTIRYSVFTFFTSFFVGGFKAGEKAREKWYISNQHAKFVSPFEAKRKLQDYVYIHFFRDGFMWGMRVGFATIIFCFCIFGIPAYRDKDSIVEFSIGGALVGAIVRASHGLKATFIGASLGSLFSSSVGVVFFLLSEFKISDGRNLQFDYWFTRRQRAVTDVPLKSANPKLNQPIPTSLETNKQNLETATVAENSEK